MFCEAIFSESRIEEKALGPSSLPSHSRKASYFAFRICLLSDRTPGCVRWNHEFFAYKHLTYTVLWVTGFWYPFFRTFLPISFNLFFFFKI